MLYLGFEPGAAGLYALTIPLSKIFWRQNKFWIFSLVYHK